MEALGAAASIIAVLELSGKVLSHIRSAKGAAKERQRLRDEVQACDDILQQLQEDAENSDEQTAWSKKFAALEKPGGPLSRLLVTLAMIKGKLEGSSKSNSRSRQIVASLKWPFDEKEVDKLVVALEREKTLLGLALTIETQKLLHKIEETSMKNNQYLKELLRSFEDTSRSWEGHFLQLEVGVDTMIRSQETQEERENNRTILDWLSPLDFTSQQNDFIKRRQADTGLWFLQSEEYQHWVTTAKETLFCPGMPGAGKTILASILIEDLYERYRNQSNVGIAYIYCNFRRQETQTIEDLFSSLLKQLVCCKSSIPKAVQVLYHQHQGRRSRPALQEIIATLEYVLKDFERAFVIVDALDECQDYDNCRLKLIQQISSMQTEVALNFFATSRNTPDVLEKFHGAQKIEIRASVADIGRYLIGRMPQLPGCVQRSTNLQEEIVTEVTKSADGMFLLAQLHMEALAGKTTIKSLRTALKRLGSGLNAYDTAYNDAMARITGQLEDHKELALQVLMWITCAKSQLTARALQHALAVQVGESSLDEDDFVDINDIISVCAGLVTIDEQSNIVCLVHYTTQEYFQRQEIQHKWFPAAQDIISMVCTTYLGFDDFAEGACEDTDKRRARLKKHPFYRYAARNWARHLHLGSVDWGSMTFLKSENTIGSCLEEAGSIHVWRSQYIHRTMFWMDELASQASPRYRGLTALHLAAHCGINELVLFLDASDVNEADCRKRTPLYYAAEQGHVQTVQLLLDKGADTEVIDVHGQSALSSAVERGHTEIVRMLLRDGANPNLHGPGQSPLSRAIENNDSEVLQMLIDHKVNIDAREGKERNRTPLMLAAKMVHTEALHILLRNGADVDAHNEDGRCALMIAATDGLGTGGAAAEESICLLLKYGATIHKNHDLRSFPWHIVHKLDWDKDLDLIWEILKAHRLPGL